MHAQSCASLVQLTSESFSDLFGTTNQNDFERIKELFEIVFKESELTGIFDNISKENPFKTKIEGKLSGGGRRWAMVFIIESHANNVASICDQ